MTIRLPLLCGLCLLLLVACDPGPVQRPLEGAPVGGGPAARDGDGGSPALTSVPPTLAPAGPFQGRGDNGAPRPGASPSPSPSPRRGEAGYVIVATDGAGANLRERPSISARVLSALAEGTAVEVLGEPVTVEGRAWRQIRGGGHEGWVVAVVVRRR